MPQLSCYLCGDFLDVERCETSTKLDTTEMRHVHCFDTVPPHLQVPHIQNFLRECVEPSFFAFDDDLEHRKIELWKTAFSQILGPQPTSDHWMGTFPRPLSLASLPRELRDVIARLCYGHPSAHALMLEYSIARAMVLDGLELPPPVREVTLCFHEGVSLAAHRMQIGGRSYVVDIQSMDDYYTMQSSQHSDAFPSEYHKAHASKQSGWNARFSRSADDWTDYMFVFDVFGCRDILPFPIVTPKRRTGIWYQYIHRNATELTFTFGGFTLRGVEQQNPVYDQAYETFPPVDFQDIYVERNAPGFDLPARMTPRTVGHDLTAITAVIYGATIVDMHFHSRQSGIGETNAFYQSLNRFDHKVIIRHLDLWPGESLQSILLLQNTELDEESSVSYLFATSTTRTIDLWPRQYRATAFPPGVRFCDMDIILYLCAPVRAIWLNKRTNHSTGARVWVESGEPIAVDDDDQGLFKVYIESASEAPPASLRVFDNDATFRDQIVLRGEFDLWERADPRGFLACFGMRAAGVILGSWRDMEAERSGANSHVWGPSDIISRRNLNGWYLENVEAEGRCDVRLLRKHEPRPAGKHFLLYEGCMIVWWSGERGNHVDVR